MAKLPVLITRIDIDAGAERKNYLVQAKQGDKATRFVSVLIVEDGKEYVMPPDYMGDAVTITMDAVAAATAPEITEEMYEQLDYLEKHPEENYYENEENFSQYDQGD